MILKHIFKRWSKHPAEKPNIAARPGTNPGIELWEEDYLVKKIQSQYINVAEDTIRNAVKSCYAIFRSPQSAEKMVEYVISRLNSEELQLKQVE